MNHSPPPMIHSRSSGVTVRFQPRRQWDLVSVERFEVIVEGMIPVSHLRHAYSTLNDLKASVTFADLERLLRDRLAGSMFQEVMIESPPITATRASTPLMCWGVYTPPEQRPQLFYIEGGFHVLPRGVRFEFYAGTVMGLGSINASTLASELLRVAGIPIQPSHPTVINLDPLTETSLACCLEWGWKLPRRKVDSHIVVGEYQLSFIAGESVKRHRARSQDLETLDRTGVTLEHRTHLKALRALHEGDRLTHSRELESAQIFYRSHLDHPQGATRYAELTLHRSGDKEDLLKWLKSSPISACDQTRIRALVAEDELSHKQAADEWARLIELLRDLQPTQETPRESQGDAQETPRESQGDTRDPQEAESAVQSHLWSPHAIPLITGLAHFTRGLLLREVDRVASLESLEAARALLPNSLTLLHTCAQIATLLDDRFLAQARLTEMAQRFISTQRPLEAAQTWVALGDLWLYDAQTWGSAERAYLKAIEINADSTAAHYQLADVYLKRGQRDDARSLLESLLERAPYAQGAIDRLNTIKDLPLTSLNHESAFAHSRDYASNIAEVDPYRRVAQLVTIIPKDSSDDIPALEESTPPVESTSMSPERPQSSDYGLTPLSATSVSQLWSTPPRGVQAQLTQPLSPPEPQPEVNEIAKQERGREISPLMSTSSRAVSTLSDDAQAMGESARKDIRSKAQEDGELSAPKPMRSRSQTPQTADKLERERVSQRARELTVYLAQANSDDPGDAQLSLELAYIYRDQLLDIEQAKVTLWDGVQRGLQDPVVYELGEALVELYTSDHNLEGLSHYYELIATRSPRDAVGASLQRAAILRELGDHKHALVVCIAGMDAYQDLESRTRRELRAENERLVRLRAALLVQTGDVELAGELLLTDLDQLDDSELVSRKIEAARTYAGSAPERTHDLYRELYQLSATPESIEVWLAHVNMWGDAHARAEVIRLYAERLSLDATTQHRAPRCLSQLADEVKTSAPLLALELYFEALERFANPEVAERASELAEQHGQHQALARALTALIEGSLPGEYRGYLKLKRAFAFASIHDPQSFASFIEALGELAPLSAELEDVEELKDIVDWGRGVCDPDVYRQYKEQLVISKVIPEDPVERAVDDHDDAHDGAHTGDYNNDARDYHPVESEA